MAYEDGLKGKYGFKRILPADNSVTGPFVAVKAINGDATFVKAGTTVVANTDKPEDDDVLKDSIPWTGNFAAVQIATGVVVAYFAEEQTS